MEKEIYLQYYPEDKEIHIWLTPSNAQRSCADDKNQHGAAHNDGLQDGQKREDFSPSSAPGDETKIVSQYDDGICYQEKIMTLEHGRFFELYNALAQVNIKEFLENNGEGDADGATFEIAFGGITDKIHYELQVHKDNMEKRKVKKLCEAVKRILEISGIDKAEYENDFEGGNNAPK